MVRPVVAQVVTFATLTVEPAQDALLLSDEGGAYVVDGSSTGAFVGVVANDLNGTATPPTLAISPTHQPPALLQHQPLGTKKADTLRDGRGRTALGLDTDTAMSPSNQSFRY